MDTWQMCSSLQSATTLTSPKTITLLQVLLKQILLRGKTTTLIRMLLCGMGIAKAQLA